MRVLENKSVAIEKGHLKRSLKLWPTNVIKFCYMHTNISPLCRLDLLNCLCWRDVFELIVITSRIMRWAFGKMHCEHFVSDLNLFDDIKLMRKNNLT